MSEPVWWCPGCGQVEDNIEAYGRRHPCSGTPVDLVAERERLLEWLALISNTSRHHSDDLKPSDMRLRRIHNWTKDAAGGKAIEWREARSE